MERKWNTGVFENICLLKNVTLNAIESFQQGQEYHGPDVWQQCEEFGIDIMDFADTPMHLFYLDIKKYIISMFLTLLIEAESRLWKVGKPIVGSVKRECT